MQTVLITGGLGFVGTNLTNFLARKGYRIVIVDKGTYAADPANLDCQPDIFIRDLCCGIQDVLTAYKPQIIINLAAESHVDNSIKSSMVFWESNVIGTAMLMEQMAKIVPEARVIHFSCYDEQTKALTKEGLKNYWELKEGDLVLSLNPETNTFEEKPIEKVIIQDYDGEMVHFNTNMTDMMVTPNHRMYYKTHLNDRIKICEAKECLSKTNLYYPTGEWAGKYLPTTFIPEIGQVDSSALFYVCGAFLGDGFTAYQEKRIKTKTGLNKQDYSKIRDNKGRFTAVLERGNYEYSISKSYRIFFDIPENDKCRKRLEDSLTKLGIDWSAQKGKSGEHIYFTSKEWLEFFDNNLGKGFYNKSIPQWMLEYDSKFLKSMFDGMIDSDGTYHQQSKAPIFTTSSPTLRDSILELGFKLGFYPRFRINNKPGDKILFKKENRYINCNTESYMIHFRACRIGIGKGRNSLVSSYRGKIWCLKIKDNKNFITCRNGICAVSGNTDEIYGPAHVLNLNGFSEEEPFNPVSPYACSKAAQELAVKSTVRNYDLKNVCIVRPNNIYGPRQHKEKFIPTIVNSVLNDKPIPVYGDGKQQRPWLFIDDLCQAVYLLISNRNKWYKEDEFFTYNIQAARHDEEYNINLVKKILTLLDKPDTLISYVEDRKNHDRRYLTNGTSFRADFNWEPLVGLNDGLKETIQWYKERLNG